MLTSSSAIVRIGNQASSSFNEWSVHIEVLSVYLEFWLIEAQLDQYLMQKAEYFWTFVALEVKTCLLSQMYCHYQLKVQWYVSLFLNNKKLKKREKNKLNIKPVDLIILHLYQIQSVIDLANKISFIFT